MESNYRELDYSRHRLSTSSEERTIFYIDDMSPPQDSSPTSDVALSANVCQHHHQHSRLCEPPDVTLAPSLQPPRPRSQSSRRNSSVSSQCGGGNVSGTGRPRRQRRPSECIEHSGRRSSNSLSGSGRPRANSCNRPTPLGDGRRASVCKKVSSGSGGGGSTRTRRPSAVHRRDSIRPVRSEGTRSPSVLLTPTSVEAATIKDPRLEQQARRHRRIAMVLLGTFIFILAASVLAVVVTLTHSSFHKPPTGSRELAEHRANVRSIGSAGSLHAPATAPPLS